jgi:hypothetical protein
MLPWTRCIQRTKLAREALDPIHRPVPLLHPFHPVVELNRAVAVAMANGPKAGLKIIYEIETRGELNDNYLMWSAKADLLRRISLFADTERYYQHALELVGSEPERTLSSGGLPRFHREGVINIPLGETATLG